MSGAERLRGEVLGGESRRVLILMEGWEGDARGLGFRGEGFFFIVGFQVRLFRSAYSIPAKSGAI